MAPEMREHASGVHLITRPTWMDDFPNVRFHPLQRTPLKLNINAPLFVDALRNRGHRRSCGYSPPEMFKSPPYTLVFVPALPRTVRQRGVAILAPRNPPAIAHGQMSEMSFAQYDMSTAHPLIA